MMAVRIPVRYMLQGPGGLAVRTPGLQSEGRGFEPDRGHPFPPSSSSLSRCGRPGSIPALVQPRLYGSKRRIVAMLMVFVVRFGRPRCPIEDCRDFRSA